MVILDLDKLYARNVNALWTACLPSPDIYEIKEDGSYTRVELTTAQIATHYLKSIGQLTLSLIAFPFIGTLRCLASLMGRAKPLRRPEETYSIETFGFASSAFQDGGVGTSLDPSSLKGQGTGDWEKIMQKAPQRVDDNGTKIPPLTHGVTLPKGAYIEDCFTNLMDHPQELASILKELGCNAYRISLERSVLEPAEGEFNGKAVEKYHKLFEALQEERIEPWVTLVHFTEPQWLEDEGGFTTPDNIDSFVNYAKEMVKIFPEITHWMTFNEPGIRALEGYIRGEHPPQQTHLPTGAKVIRNLLLAHDQAYRAMKGINPNLHVGLTHQWLKFLPYGWNPIEKITAHFFTSLIHTPLLSFFKEGEMKIQIPFRANVQLRYEKGYLPVFADFLGVQAYGFPRVKVGFSRHPHPGAGDKVSNFLHRWLGFGFTTGSTCAPGGSMQYFGPPSSPEDLYEVLEEAFSIPRTRTPQTAITETGSDAKRMDFGQKDIRIDDAAQAQGLKDIFDVISHYPLSGVFVWTLNRHLEWLSGPMPNLGLTRLKNDPEGLTYEKTAGIEKISEIFHRMQKEQQAA